MAKNKIPKLIVERTENQQNFCFLSVLEYRKKNYLVVVDNITDTNIGAYVLDYVSQEKIDMEQLLKVITTWFYKNSHKCPLSFEFSKLGLTSEVNKIYKNFELVHVARLIGNDFRYTSLLKLPKIKRRRITKIPAGVEIKLKKNMNY